MRAPGPDLLLVSETVAALIPQWYGAGARVEGEMAVSLRPWSVHLLPVVVTPAGSIPLVVKIPLWEEAPDLGSALAAGPQQDTREEYRALEAIAAVVIGCGDPRITAVHPVAYVEELNAVVTERLDSRPLRRVGRRLWLRSAPAVGAWLRIFHDQVGGAGPAEFHPMLVEDRLVALESAARTGPRDLREGVSGIASLTATLAGAGCRVGVAHGDMGPSNVLITPDTSVAVIDPNRALGPVEQDPAKLVATLYTGRRRLLSGVPAGEERDRFEQRLFEGYGEADGDVYRLFRGLAVAERWVDVEASAEGWARRAALLPARRVLSAELAGCLAAG